MTAQRYEVHHGRVVRCFAERFATADLAFRASARAWATKIALVDGDRSLTYGELDALVDRLARGLLERSVEAGDRVAVMLPNSLEAIAVVLASARIGAVVVPVGMRLRRPEIAHMLADADVALLVYGHEFEAELPSPDDCRPPAERRFCVGQGAGGPSFDDLLREGAPLAFAPIGEDDAFGILYTSGTTGRPKGAVLTHLNVVHSSMHWVERLEFGNDEVTLLVIPWGHVAGLCGVVLPFLLRGGRLVVMGEFKAEQFLALAASQQITHALLVPAMYGLCLLGGGLEGHDLSRWRLGVYGSAPMPEATIRRFAEAVPHLSMCNAYGATETASPATIMPPRDGRVRTDSIGKTVSCGDILVMDAGGRQVPAGVDGELWIAGPMIVAGYWRNPEATAASFVSGYWKSGDVGSVDAGGFVRIADRIKDMVNRGGYKIYPAEVENVLVEHPDVVEAAVVGRPDEILGERVVAFVRSINPALASDELRSHCAMRSADYKVPDLVIVGDDGLPRNANGKIQKDQLRQAARSWPGQATARTGGSRS